MAEGSLFEETLRAWRYTRDGVIAELENIPASAFSYRPSPASRTVAELARHLIESGLMAAGELSRPDGSFERQSYPEFLREYAGSRAETTEKATLVSLLKTTHAESIARLRQAGSVAMERPIVQLTASRPRG
ncbi:hypothetical protein BH23ACI1_BH23ACI1_19480 [soil metagenome]